MRERHLPHQTAGSGIEEEKGIDIGIDRRDELTAVKPQYSVSLSLEAMQSLSEQQSLEEMALTKPVKNPQKQAFDLSWTEFRYPRL